MSKELSGYTNRLSENSDGTITKFFRDEGVTSRPAHQRQLAELHALGTFPLSPDLIDIKNGAVTMTTVAGERELDSLIDQLPASLQASIFSAVGVTLALIHNQYRQPITEKYLQGMVADSILRVEQITGVLESLSISPVHLQKYFQDPPKVQEIKRAGLAVTHGDYWLNNIIGQIHGQKFNVSGIIDWEMSQIASPYCDLASVELSVLAYHPLANGQFWKGYCLIPQPEVLRYFCLRQIVTWISEDQRPNFNSSFYKGKIDLLKKTI